MAQGQPDLTGRVALVTGASRGIGRAIAQRLAAAGATVIITARSAGMAVPGKRKGADRLISGTLEETRALIEEAGGRAIVLPADLENPAERAGLIARATDAGGGRLDILINNAGFADYARIEAMSDETFERTITHYLRAPFELARDAIPGMKARGEGWIVNIGSVTAMSALQPFAPHHMRGGDTLYASIKASLHRFSQGLAAEMLNDNIAVNAVGPSTAIRTPGADDLIPKEYPTEDVAYIAATVLAMCHLPAAERTGNVAFSMHWPAHHKLQVMSLDGRTELPPAEPPAWSHPHIIAAGI